MVYSVLIVDDDVKIADLLHAYFSKEGFTTYLAHDGMQALEAIREKSPDIVILDLMLPGLDGWEICRQVRKELNTPILMLTARDEETDRLIGLEIGADDYVTKPFSPREVVARAKAILRRSQPIGGKPETQRIRIGKLFIDIEQHTVQYDGELVELTPSEFKILEFLASHPGRVFTRLQLVEQIQEFAFEGYERTIDAHIKNLRRKLGKGAQLIQTVYGVGYKFAGEENA